MDDAKREKHRLYQREYRAKHPERCRAYQRAYRARTKGEPLTAERREKLRVYQREYYRRNREKRQAAYRRRYRERAAQRAAAREAVLAERRREARAAYRDHVRRRSDVWRKIKGYPYEVNRDGVVMRIGGKQLKHVRARGGPVRVTLRRGADDFTHRYVRELVLEAFVGPRPPGKHGVERDGDVTHVALANLYWGADGRQRRARRAPRAPREAMESLSRFGQLTKKSQAMLSRPLTAGARHE